MKQVAIFMSDFHLGQLDRIEKFRVDEEFAELLGRLSVQHAEEDVDLVLLGDVMDLWKTITDPKEVHARSSADVRLTFPLAVDDELARVVAITKRHPKFFEALGLFVTFGTKTRRIIYVPGNHDHSLVHPQLQELVRDAILAPSVCRVRELNSAAISTMKQERLRFDTYYDNPVLQVYAEHGSQLTYKGIYQYDVFQDFGAECKGYYEIKLVMNRMERRSAELENVLMGALSPGQWPGAFWWLVHRIPLGLSSYLRHCSFQYQQDEQIQLYRDAMPPAWRTVLHFLNSRWFGATHDEFGDAVPKLFDPTKNGVLPLKGSCLNPEEVKTVILGHSHESRDVDLPGLSGVKYYNTGSWIYHYENGRRVIEQTWVTVSRETSTATSQGGRNDRDRVDIDRQMDRRRVELPMTQMSPVTTSGQSLNALARQMPDLRVGDVVLVRWNMLKEAKRLMKAGQFFPLFRKIPQMVGSWLNRYGTSSYWSHVALVFASPSEPQESEEYNDPLFLEALPEGGVGIHSTHEYLTYPGEWDLAVLRLNIDRAPWLHDQARVTVKRGGTTLSFTLPPETLKTLKELLVKQDEKPPCLAQLAPKSPASQAGLQAGDVVIDVDQVPISDQKALENAIEHKDGWQHRCLLRRLALSTLDAHYATGEIVRQSLYFASKMLDSRTEQRDYAPLVAGIFKGGIAGLVVGLVLLAGGILGSLIMHGKAVWMAVSEFAKWTWNALPTWWQHCGELCHVFTKDFLLGVVGLILLLVIVGIVVAAGAALLRALVMAYGYLTIALGAAWGALIVPVMAELSGGWTKRTPEWRWAATLVWGTIPLLPLAGWYWQRDANVVGAWMMLSALAVVWVPLLTDVLARGLAPVVERVRQKKKFLKQALKWRQSEQQYMCSGLVQHALYKMAVEVKDYHSSLPLENVIVHPEPTAILAEPADKRDRMLKETIPRDFALSDRFQWLYLMTGGVVIANPSEAHKADVESVPLPEKERTVTGWATWSLRAALLALACTVLHEFEPWAWTEHGWLLLTGGGIGLLAYVCARIAWRKLTLEPDTWDGWWLTRWGNRLGWFALGSAAVAALSHL